MTSQGVLGSIGWKIDHINAWNFSKIYSEISTQFGHSVYVLQNDNTK